MSARKRLRKSRNKQKKLDEKIAKEAEETRVLFLGMATAPAPAPTSDGNFLAPYVRGPGSTLARMLNGMLDGMSAEKLGNMPREIVSRICTIVDEEIESEQAIVTQLIGLLEKRKTEKDQLFEELKAIEDQSLEEDRANMDQVLKKERAKIESFFQEKKATIESFFQKGKVNIESFFKEEKASIESTFQKEKANIESFFEEEKANVESTFQKKKATYESTFQKEKSSLLVHTQSKLEALRAVKLRMISLSGERQTENEDHMIVPLSEAGP